MQTSQVVFVYTPTPHTPGDWKVGLFSSLLPIYYFQFITICPRGGGRNPPPLKLMPFHDVTPFPLFKDTHQLPGHSVWNSGSKQGPPSLCELSHGSGRLRGSRMKTCLILCPSPHFLDVPSPQRPAAPKTARVLGTTGRSPSRSLSLPTSPPSDVISASSLLPRRFLTLRRPSIYPAGIMSSFNNTLTDILMSLFLFLLPLRQNTSPG